MFNFKLDLDYLTTVDMFTYMCHILHINYSVVDIE